MPKIGKILLFILFTVIIIISIWGFIFFKNKQSDTPPKTIEVNNEENRTVPDNSSSDTDTTNNQPTIENGPAAPENQTPETSENLDVKLSGNVLAHITPQHCDDRCQAFKIDLRLFEYCQEACGISPVKKVSSCDDKKDLEKDYCLKDLAIGKQDASACEKIKDDNIKKACAAIIEENTFRQMQQQTGSQRENPPY